MAARQSTGHESWVFRARALDQLCGVHPDLVAQALQPGERVEFLLYSPVREAPGAPFGIQAPSGSHALAVTDAGVVVSRDPHRRGAPRTVRAIGYDDILAVELGEALTLGWLAFRFATTDGLASETVLFQSTGMDLFREAVRTLRRRGVSAAAASTLSPEWLALLAPAPPYLRSALVPVLLGDERPHAVVHAAEHWRQRRGGRPAACLCGNSLYAVTESGLVFVESERPPRPGTLVFAVNLTCIERRVLDHVLVGRDTPDATEGVVDLGVDLEAAGVRRRLTLTLGADASRDLTEAIGQIQRSAPASR